VDGDVVSRNPPTLIHLERVIAIGEPQTHGLVTLALISLAIFREGWSVSLYLVVDETHPQFRVDAVSPDAAQIPFEQRFRPSYPQMVLSVVGDDGKARRAWPGSGGFGVGDGGVLVGEMTFQLDPVPADAVQVVTIRVDDVHWVQSPIERGARPQTMQVDPGPWSWTVTL